MREVGKVFGLTEDTVGTLLSTILGYSNQPSEEKHLRVAELDSQKRVIAIVTKIARELIRFS